MPRDLCNGIRTLILTCGGVYHELTLSELYVEDTEPSICSTLCLLWQTTATLSSSTSIIYSNLYWIFDERYGNLPRQKAQVWKQVVLSWKWPRARGEWCRVMVIQNQPTLTWWSRPDCPRTWWSEKVVSLVSSESLSKEYNLKSLIRDSISNYWPRYRGNYAASKTPPPKRRYLPW